MENKEKKVIYYSRTYRHLKINTAGSILYFCLLVLPVLILFIFNMSSQVKRHSTANFRQVVCR